jgi:hypothetical protein
MTICFGILSAVLPRYLPDKIGIGVCIGAAIGAIVGIGLWLYGRRLGKQEESEQKIKSLAVRKENKEINNILNTVEAMDNRLYQLLSRAEKKHITMHPNLNKTIGSALTTVWDVCRIWLWYHPYILWANPQNGGERLSEFMDEKQLGLERYTKDKTYSSLESKVNQMLRLKGIEFRNTVYTFIRFSYGYNSELLYFGILKKTLVIVPTPFGMVVRRLNKARQQIVGNMLSALAVKLGEYATTG